MGTDQLAEQLAAIREELAGLRREVHALRQLFERLPTAEHTLGAGLRQASELPPESVARCDGIPPEAVLPQTVLG